MIIKTIHYKKNMENRKYWTGNKLTFLNTDKNDIFVMGTNPEGRHGSGAAKTAVDNFGAIFGQSRGLMGNSYGIVTKNLSAGFVEKSTGVKYDREGWRSVSEEQIRQNIADLYQDALKYPDKNFLISYQYDTWPNGSPKKSLNGYTSKEMLEMFVVNQDIPDNIVFHDSYKVHLEKILSKNNKPTPSSLPNKDNISTQQSQINNLIVISPRDNVPEGFTIINTTSKDTGHLGKLLSPFYLSNIELYEGQVAKNLENAWQFSKVYAEFADIHENPTEDYFKWAKKGWNDSFAHRYANGKGNVPLYSYWKTFNENSQCWEEHKWDYVTARKNIYFPLYAKAVVQSPAFQELKQRVEQGEKIALWDFDGYDHAKRGMTYEDVVNSAQYKCGHAFVIYGLLTGQLKLQNNELIYDFNNEIKMENTNNKIATSASEYTYFFHLTSPFSNFHPAKFEYKDLTFISNEQFMMYSKAKTFKDEKTAERIMNIYNEFMIEPGVFKDQEQNLCFQLASAFKRGEITREQVLSRKENSDAWNTIHKKIKLLGREVKNYDDEVWNKRRASVVLFGAREKFTQNADLKQILINTGDTIMVEASKFDKIWGIGLDEYTAKRTPPENWPGLNLLGQVLDYLKTEFKKNLVKKMKM